MKYDIEIPEGYKVKSVSESRNFGNLSLRVDLEPEKKVIDLSTVINSGVDCEFWGILEENIGFRGQLEGIGSCLRVEYKAEDETWYGACRIREGYYHGWKGGRECPLPEGLRVKVYTRDGRWHILETRGYAKWSTWCWYDEIQGPNDVIGFEVISVAMGWKYAYE